MRRHILAVGLAGLLAFSTAVPPASAADLGMPVKAPPITEAPPPVYDYTWLWVALGLAALGVGIACAVDFCEHHGGPPAPATSGGNPHPASG
jgi:hypothetical protein